MAAHQSSSKPTENVSALDDSSPSRINTPTQPRISFVQALSFDAKAIDFIPIHGRHSHEYQHFFEHTIEVRHAPCASSVSVGFHRRTIRYGD